MFKSGDVVEFITRYDNGIQIGDKGVVVGYDFDFVGDRPENSLIIVKMDKDGRETVCCAYRLTLVEPKAPMHRELVRMVSKVSAEIGKRDRNAVFHSLVEEVGELATEISIENGTKKREPSLDGVIGETIDVLVVALDLLHLELGDKINSPEFLDRVQQKLDKWASRA